MEKLIEMLAELEGDASLKSTEGDYLYNEDHPLCIPISNIATDLFITYDGDCDWDMMDRLESNGFRIIPIERDSFGWLIGGICTKKGIICYG